MSDPFTVRAVVVGLIIMAAGALVAGTILALRELAVPEFIVATGSAAVGALGAMLARTSSSIEVHQAEQVGPKGGE